MYAAHCASLARMCDVLEGARFERRPGYVWMTCPSIPVPSFNNVMPEDDAAAGALQSAPSGNAAQGGAPRPAGRRGEKPARATGGRGAGLVGREGEARR